MRKIFPTSDSSTRARRPARLVAWLTAGLCGALFAGPASLADTRGSEDLAGTWYVLTHYRDLGEGGPDGLQWDDEIWRIEKEKEGRLRWTLFPHVVFRDPEGRYERLESGAEARTEGAWAPNAAQRAEIASGLPLDDHESRSKSLRGSPERGYRSRPAPPLRSASAIGYQESWSIEWVDGLPVFTRQDTLASGRAESAEGVTVFRGVGRSPEGELVGSFRRDGVLVGEFRMRPVGRPLPTGPPRTETQPAPGAESSE